jgi:hypothetical protein
MERETLNAARSAPDIFLRAGTHRVYGRELKSPFPEAVIMGPGGMP